MKKVLFFLMLAMFCLPWAMRAQETLTVADGTNTNDYVPVYGYYCDTEGNKTQTIYPASDLSEMAGGTISGLTYYLSSPAVAAWGATFEVKLTEITESTFSSEAAMDVSSATVVYTGELDGTGSTMTIAFDQDYTYNGGNLLVDITVIESGSYKSAFFYGFTTTTDVSYNEYEAWGYTYANIIPFIPKTTFTYTPASTGCDMPTSITVNFISPTGAYVDWEGGGSAWNLRYKASTDDEWSLIEGLTTTNYTFDNTLVSNTTYSVGVQTVCTGSTSSFRSTSFTTPCSIVSIPAAGWTENFDDLTVESNYYAPPTRVLPDCWKAINNTTNSSYKQFPTALNYNYANSTPNCLKFYSYDYNNNYDAQPQYAILPMMSNLTGKQITLQAKGYNDVSTFKIGTMTDPTDPTTFTQISEQALTTSYQEFSYPLFGTNVYVAIMIDAADDDRYTNGVYIDDIEIGDIPSCAKPTAPEVTATGQTATFTWTSEVGNYQIAYANSDDVDLTDVDPADHIDGTATEATYTVEELALGDYYFWVRANCGTSGYSTWAGPASVHIGYCVPNPSSHDGSGITGVSFGTGDYVVTNGDGSASLPATSPFYGDYSSMTGAVQAGVESTIAITTGTNIYPYTFVIWVDLDNSLSFEDSEIFYIGKAPSGNGTFNATITIPATQAEGNYRMRIYGADSYFDNFYNNGTTNWEAAHDPCNSGTYCHAHDYTLRVLEAPSCLTPTALTLSRSEDQITAEWVGTAATYNIDINGTVTENVTSPYSFTADLSTTYTVTVQANCGGETSDWSNASSITSPDCWSGRTIDYTLIDQYDDSWNGASISVIGDCGAYNETLTVASGASPLSGTLNLCGDYYEFIWNKGSYDGECSFTFTEGGTTLFTKPSSVSDGLVLYTIGTQSCPKPTALENEDPEAHSVVLSWTEGGTAEIWQICVNNDEENLIDVTENPYTLNLDPETYYVVKVRAKCGADEVSCWSDSVTFTTPAVCPKPTNLTAQNPGSTSVALRWYVNGGETAWQISTGDDENPIDVVADDVSRTHTVIGGNIVTYLDYTLTGLTAETEYTVKVRANCVDEDAVSDWSNSENFTTAASCPTPVLVASGITNIAGHTADVAWTGFDQNDSYEVHYRTAEYVDGFYEEFGSSLPTGWTKYGGLVNGVVEGNAELNTTSISNPAWRISTYAFGNYNLTLNIYGGSCNRWIVTPGITLANGSVLNFDLALTDYGNSNAIEDNTAQSDDRLVVLITDDDGASWNILREWNNSGSSYVYNDIATSGENVAIDLSNYTGAVKIAFYGESTVGSNGDNDIHIDNVIIGTPVAAGAWQTENVAAPATSTTLANLDPETTYEVYVTGHCATGDVTTDPSATQTFKTTVACIAPTGLEVTANGVDATFTWESEVGSYEIARATTSDANPNEFVVGTADEESYAMNDLDLGDYYLWVRANCDGEDNSTWSGPVSLHIGYCLPDPSSRDGKGITKVVFGTGENIVNNVDETNGLPSSAPYYGDYSAMVGAVPAGTEATIDITYNTCGSSCFNYGTLIWVDWDNSLTFEDDELVFVGQSSSEQNPSGAHTLNATFTIPVDQALGNYRMRIAGADSYFDSYINGNATAYHSACFSHNYTVCHDYTLQVLEAPSCFAPTDLAVTYEGGTEATVSWTSEATAWNIDVNGTVTAITENPYTLSGLELATNYAVKVQAVCDAANSDWTNPENFSTDLCMPENQCELTFVLTDSYGDGWSGNKIVVTDVATGKVLGQLANTNANGGSGCNSCAETETYTLAVCNGREIQFSWVSGSFDGETSYTVYDLNGNEIFSGSGVMSAPVNYTVNCASCAPVTELEASVNGFDVTLTWEPGGSETDWAIRYREEGTADWNEDINDGSEYEIAGLLPGDYEAEVRALCGSSVTSGWTSTTFTVECPNYSGEETVSICADSYEWNGETYTTSGDKQKHFTLANGCDSLATLHLTLKSPSYYTDVVNVCGTSYTWHGTTYTNSITGPTYTTTNAAGCDSVVTLNLTLRKPTAYTEVVNVCGTSYTWHGTTYYNSINGPTYTTTNAAGCDSVVTLNLTLRKPSAYTEVVDICGTSYTWHGTTYTNSITGPTYTTTNAVGCDSVVTLNLTLRKPTSYTEVVNVCGTSYTWHGTTYTNSITGPTYTTTNAAGCDSVVTLNLTLRKPTAYTEVVNVCGTSYTWHGTTYYNSINGPTYTTTNAAGCDSVITLNLTLRKPSTYTEVVNICGTSYTWHGTTYTNSINGPTYTTTNAAGCDSVVTLNLTLRKPTTGIDKVEACNTFTWINGQTYNQSITGPTYTLTNAAGCDSVVTLNLTIYKSVTVNLYDTICEGSAYNNNGIYIRMADVVEGDHDYTFDHQTTHQCDSTVVLHLHVNICDELCGQPIEDIDHNSYGTMPVHRVCWMTSNLRTTRYADGTNIPFAIVYSYPYDPNNTDNLETFGRLYNWTSASKAVGTPLQGVCPDGWRLPTQAEFDELSLYFTESQLRSTDNWLQNPGTNESGFNKQPGGFYNGTTGKCERLGAAAHFYTADFQATGVTYQYSEYYCDGVLYDVTNNPQDGRSIRCVRDLVSQ